MNHAQLRAFNAVAENGGFTAAANALGLTQPALTLQVQALEQRYNMKLFHRRGRRTELTPSGVKLLALSKRIFSLEKEAHLLLTSMKTLRTGLLRITAPSALNTLPLISRFCFEYPDIILDFDLAAPDEIEGQILDCHIDIGFLRHEARNRRIHSRKLSEDPVKLAVSCNHPWAGRTSVSPAEIRDIRIVLPRRDGETVPENFHWFHILSLRKEKTLVLENREVSREAVASNLGAAFLTEREVVGDSRVRLVDIEGVALVSRTYLGALRDQKDSGLVASFFAMAETAWRESGTEKSTGQ